MICKVPYIENKFRQNNPDLADKLNQDYSTIYKLLKESYLFKELNNNLILSEDVNLYSKQSNLIKSINNQLKAQVVLEYNNKISINVLPLSIDSLNKNIIQEIVFTQNINESKKKENNETILNLEKKLIDGFLTDFNITVTEYESIKKDLGFNAYSMSDLITKEIAVERGHTILPEVAYFAYFLLGKQNNKLKSELKYLIHKWDKYSEKFEYHKKIISETIGFLENKEEWINKVRDLVILDFLQENLINHYENPKEFEKQLDTKWTREDFTMWKKIVKEIENFLTKLRFQFKSDKYKLKKLENIGLSIADEILNQNYDYFNYNLKEDQVIKDYEETINKDLFAKELIEFGTKELDLIITGSLVLRKEGTLYRTEDESIHDIDWIVPVNLNINKEFINFMDSVKSQYAHNENEDEINGIALNYITKLDWFKKFIDKYHSYQILNNFWESDLNKFTMIGVIDGEFYNENGYHTEILTYYVKDPITKRAVKTSKEVERYHEKGEWIKDTGYLIDFFVNFQEEEILPKINDGFAYWKHIMKAKLRFSRDKDIIDWKNFILFTKDKYNDTFKYESFRHINWKENNQNYALENTAENIDVTSNTNTQYSDYLSQPELLTNLVIVDYQKENNIFSKYYTDELSYDEQSEWLEIYNLNIPDEAKYYILNNLTDLPYNETAISEFVSQTDYDYNLPYQYRIKLLEVLLRDNPLNNNSIITTNKDFLKVFGIIRQDEEYKIEFKSYTNQKGISIPTVIVNGDEYTGFWNDEFDGIHFNPITMETKINNNEDFIKESIKYKGLKNMMSNKDYENYLKMNDSEKLNFLEILFNTQLNEQDVKDNNEHIIKHVLIEEENNITNLPTCI